MKVGKAHTTPVTVATVDPPAVAEATLQAEASDQTFREVFLQHYPRVLGLLMRVVRHAAEAEEIADDVFLKLHKHLGVDWDAARVSGWLYRTATRAGLDALRSRGRRQKYEDHAARLQPSVANDDPSRLLLQEERRQVVRKVLVHLKPEQAQLLLLRYAGFSYQEIATALKLKASSVGTMLVRAEARFAAVYSEVNAHEQV